MAKQTSSRSSPTPTKRKRTSSAPAPLPTAPTDDVAADVAADMTATSPAARAPTHEEIAARALEIYRARGTDEGNELSDWLKAESELRP
jgi:hypothetical protein